MSIQSQIAETPVYTHAKLAKDIKDLHRYSLGDPGVRVAVLDGPIDLSHPCFHGANIRRIDTLVQESADNGPMSRHGTHVASQLFAQPGSSILGIVPSCRGLMAPIFRDTDESHISQLDLVRAIEQVIDEGANIINISGGERSDAGIADPILERAIQRCEDNNVLVVAATGNDGCACLHVPAALPYVLAVGALNMTGAPLDSSNWGEEYHDHGILAPGENIVGAVPGGGTAALTGSSFAAPVVSGIAASLMSIQRSHGRPIDVRAVRNAILKSAAPCVPADDPACERFLAGTLNVPAARDLIMEKGLRPVSSIEAAQVSQPEPSTDVAAAAVTDAQPEPAPAADAAPQAAEPAATASRPAMQVPNAATVRAAQESPPPGPSAGSVPSGGCGCSTGKNSYVGALPGPSAGTVASGGCGCSTGKNSYVYAIGVVGFDFGTEARRDSFRQLMPDVEVGGWAPMNRAANPYDISQLCDYLQENPWESTKLIWTLNFDQSRPVYAIMAEPSYGEIVYPRDAIYDPDPITGQGTTRRGSSSVYSILRDALKGQSLPDTSPQYISRVSIPGVLTNQTVRLFSGQVVPVVVAQTRGMYSWNEPALVQAAVQAVQEKIPNSQATYIEQNVRAFLDKVYYQLLNLGQNSSDRALNYAATNAFVFTSGILNGLLSGSYVPGADNNLFSLDTITVAKSPYCRMDSDCWDVQVTFFDPENDRRARVVYQYTIDVSDEMPVSLAPTHQFLIAV